jgi:hypothetical protein
MKLDNPKIFTGVAMDNEDIHTVNKKFRFDMYNELEQNTDYSKNEKAKINFVYRRMRKRAPNIANFTSRAALMLLRSGYSISRPQLEDQNPRRLQPSPPGPSCLP